MANPVEIWKSEKHPFDVWPNVERYAGAGTPLKEIPAPDLERMKWHGFLYRKRDASGRFMNRIRITGCELTAEQAREIAFIAYECGHGLVDVTTRANLQIQGLKIQSLPRVAERLGRVGLTSKQTGHDNIRNVFGHPFSGLLPDELIDTQSLCRDVTALFIDSREYSDLPRKMNICLNGTEKQTAHYWTQDISFLACRVDDEILFQMLIGGTQGQHPLLGRHLPVLVRPEQVVEVTRTLLDLFRAQGSREKRNTTRFRFLIDRIGVGGVLQWLEEHLSYPLQPSVSPPVPSGRYDELIGWFSQKDSRLWTMGLCVPLGRLTWRQLEGLAITARKWGDGTLRTTHEQGIAIAGIRSGFKDAAATDAAALGLSIHADPLARNTMACTGSQFCNIAVTETKGQMLRLIERLRQQALTLHGIRIHMSGCPSSCAQHFTADIGLKGVRVRRLMGTCEGFDVYLGGGISGQVHLALPYKLGVDVDQLPQLVREVTEEYYLKHRSGQTFSAYWREKLRSSEASKVGDEDYTPPTWLCEGCGYRHHGEDPPVFCPQCAGLRRLFARLETETTAQSDTVPVNTAPPAQPDGFLFAAREQDLEETAGLDVQVGGQDIALFRVAGQVQAIEGACPHEGGPLAEGDVSADGVVTCPWHDWTFNVCSGCGIDPAGQNVSHYETKVVDGNVYVQVGSEHGPSDGTAMPTAGKMFDKRRLPKPITAVLPVAEILHETPDTRTFRLDNSAGEIPMGLPGQFLKVRLSIDGHDLVRSFTISSSPGHSGFLDLTIKRNPSGKMSNHLHDSIEPGETLCVSGPHGNFVFDPERHTEPLVLISAGSGITPMMSIARFLVETDSKLPCEFLYGARTPADILFNDECRRLAEERPGFCYEVTLTQPPDNWRGCRGRIDISWVEQRVKDLVGSRYFLCGPNEFMTSLSRSLAKIDVPADHIQTEQFHADRQLTGA